MRHATRLLAAVALLTTGVTAAAVAAPGPTPGSNGVGDPYFLKDGNGGYDVRNYTLDLDFDPDTGVLSGVARIRATATQALSRFNLDLDGLTVRSVTVQGAPAS